jgi:hypothetical protein
MPKPLPAMAAPSNEVKGGAPAGVTPTTTGWGSPTRLFLQPDWKTKGAEEVEVQIFSSWQPTTARSGSAVWAAAVECAREDDASREMGKIAT